MMLVEGAGLLLGLGDQGKSKQNLKRELGGELITTL